MPGLRPYKKYFPIAYDYATQLPVGWQLLPNIAIFEERIERGYENEELLSVTIGRGVIKQTELDKKDSSTADKSKYLLVYPGDLVYSMRFRQGASGYSNYRGIVSPACTVLKPRKNIKLNPRFFYYMLRTNFYKNYVERYAYGIADGQMPLRYTDFKRMYSIVPPLEVQNAIVNYLDKKNDAIQKFIRNKEKLIEIMEEERRGFIDRTINQSFTSSFQKKPLKYIVRLVSEQTTKVKDDESYLALENIESWTGKIDLTIGADVFESNAKRFKDTDVLFNKLRPYLAKVVIPDFKGVCVNELLVLSPSKQILREFLFYKLISKRFIDYVDSTTYGSKMPRANWDLIGKVEVEFPTQINVQKNIVSKIREEENRIELLKTRILKEIVSIKEYREAIITTAVTGRVELN